MAHVLRARIKRLEESLCRARLEIKILKDEKESRRMQLTMLPKEKVMEANKMLQNERHGKFRLSQLIKRIA